MASSRWITVELSLICVWALLAAAALAAVQISVSSTHASSSSPFSAEPRLGAVASENRVCSTIGTNLLKAGGNAADAVRSLQDASERR